MIHPASSQHTQQPVTHGRMRAHTAGKARGRYTCPVTGSLVTLGQTGVQAGLTRRRRGKGVRPRLRRQRTPGPGRGVPVHAARRARARLAVTRTRGSSTTSSPTASALPARPRWSPVMLRGCPGRGRRAGPPTGSTAGTTPSVPGRTRRPVTPAGTATRGAPTQSRTEKARLVTDIVGAFPLTLLLRSTPISVTCSSRT